MAVTATSEPKSPGRQSPDTLPSHLEGPVQAGAAVGMRPMFRPCAIFFHTFVRGADSVLDLDDCADPGRGGVGVQLQAQ